MKTKQLELLATYNIKYVYCVETNTVTHESRY